MPTTCEEIQSFDGLPTGAHMRDQLAPAISVRCDNNRVDGPDECIVFDTAAVTGGDQDLAAPGQGKLVIIAENLVDSDGDGLVGRPGR